MNWKEITTKTDLRCDDCGTRLPVGTKAVQVDCKERHGEGMVFCGLSCNAASLSEWRYINREETFEEFMGRI
tara:strand:+ start:2113 stop:2328 length:216 start_codon:yes stop_codon:yes gene_type:complete